MEIDVVGMITKVGFPITVCIILSIILWKLIPVINGLKTTVSNLTIGITKLVGVVTEDSNNTRGIKTEIGHLRVEIAKMNGKK